MGSARVSPGHFSRGGLDPRHVLSVPCALIPFPGDRVLRRAANSTISRNVPRGTISLLTAFQHFAYSVAVAQFLNVI